MARKSLAQAALLRALRLRTANGIGVDQAVDVIDFASRLGIEIRYVDLPSLEAMYVRGSRPAILISCHRPSGRQVFSCAHEIGHHVFDHGSRIDDQIQSERPLDKAEPEEYLVDRFASYFLMPKTLVNRAFLTRGWSPGSASAQQIYMVANWLGVGYSTLIHQLRGGLNLLSRTAARKLLQSTPRQVAREHIGQDPGGNLVIVDFHWKDRAIDLQTGDIALLPLGIHLEGACVQYRETVAGGEIYEGIVPGIGRFLHEDEGWASYVRVSRSGYIGRAMFRHLEDPEYEQRTASH